VPSPNARTPGKARRGKALAGTTGTDGLFLLERQWCQVRQALEGLSCAERWHGGLPVLLLERCWLRLSQVAVADLATHLPPDCSLDAPELHRYRELLAEGLPSWEAQRLCWEDFGAEACREALRLYWAAQERGTQGWTLETYLDLLKEYRRRFELPGSRRLPLLVLARRQSPVHGDGHRLIWLGPDGTGVRPPMRHTCP
jgi:hypothetical protein